MADLGVFMVGGRRTGKTTILASMTRDLQAVTRGTNLLLTAANVGALGKLDNSSQALRDYFADHRNEFFYADSNSTKEKDSYTFNLRQAGQRNDEAMQIRFTDVPGEWFEADKYELHEDEIEEILDESQVVIIAVDTPALMEDQDADGIGRRHIKYNRVTEITQYMQAHLTAEENRMVLFVPLKCEKYYHMTHDALLKSEQHNYMKDVNAAVKKGYENLIGFLTCPNMREKCTVAITPIITVGGMDFFEFKEDVDEEGKNITNQTFYVRNNGTYEPRFCEQPMLYTLAMAVKEFNKSEREVQPERPRRGILWRILFGGWFSRNKQTVSEIEKLVVDSQLLHRNAEDGYEIIQNPLSI